MAMPPNCMICKYCSLPKPIAEFYDSKTMTYNYFCFACRNYYTNRKNTNRITVKYRSVPKEFASGRKGSS